MNRKILITQIALLLALSGFCQKSKVSPEELVYTFQKYLVKGLDLTPFDTISNPSTRHTQSEAFINLCMAKGMMAQTKALSTIDFKTKGTGKLLTYDELLVIIYESYKIEIPTLKESYIDYFRSKK
jgi:hypothetical protein